MAKSNDFFKAMNFKNFNEINCFQIGIVDEYDSSNNTVKVIPQHKTLLEDEETQLPILVNVPLANFGTGDFAIKMPVKRGDMVLLLFADYDIDNYKLDGVLQDINTDRMHSLDDAIALPFSFNFLQNSYVDSGSDVKLESKNNIILKTNEDELNVNALLKKIVNLESRIVALEKRL